MRLTGKVCKPCVDITAGEKGETTVLAAFNATRLYNPAMIIQDHMSEM